MRGFSHFRVAIAACLALFLAGCATASLNTPTKKLAAAKTLYTEVVEVATVLGNSGTLTNRQILSIEAARQGVRAAIDTAEALIAAEDPTAALYIQQAAEIARVFAQVVYQLRAREPVAWLHPPGNRYRPVFLQAAALMQGNSPW